MTATVETLQQKSIEYRKTLLTIIKRANAGHTGGSLSCLDILNVLEERGTARVLHGQGVRHDGEPGGRFRLYGADGAFLGVGLMSADGWLNPRRLVAADQGQIQENP